MGLQKWQHIREMCNNVRIANLWKDSFGHFPTNQDVDDLYADFEPMLFSILPQYCDPVPGAVELIKRLKNNGIKIGSTTGYTADMMAVVAPKAKEHGYIPDSIVTSESVPADHPFPWLCYKDMMAVVAPKARDHVYIPNSNVTSESVPAGRPFPWMYYKNAMNLGVYPMNHINKVGDTISDIQEGINAGCWTVGVLKGSSSLGL